MSPYIRIKVVKLPDGRFRVQYWWSIWGKTNYEYFENIESLKKWFEARVSKL